MLLGIAITGQARVKRPKSTKDQTRIEIQATEGVVKRKRMKEEETEEKRQRKGSRRHCLKRKARDTKNVSTSGPVDWDTRTQQVPEKARYNTQKVPTQPATTHTLFHTNFFFFSSLLSLSLSLCFALVSSLAAKPQGSRSGCGISSQAPRARPVHRRSPNLLAAMPQIAQRAHTGSRPTFCLIQTVGLPSRPCPGRIAVVSCHAIERRRKCLFDWRVFSCWLIDRTSLQRATSWRHLRSLHQMPRHAFWVSFIMHTEHGAAHTSSSCVMYVTLAKNITASQQRKRPKRDKKKRNATAAARHPPGSNRGR